MGFGIRIREMWGWGGGWNEIGGDGGTGMGFGIRIGVKCGENGAEKWDLG